MLRHVFEDEETGMIQLESHDTQLPIENRSDAFFVYGGSLKLPSDTNHSFFVRLLQIERIAQNGYSAMLSFASQRMSHQLRTHVVLQCCGAAARCSPILTCLRLFSEKRLIVRF